jgi:hypothetical protein
LAAAYTKLYETQGQANGGVTNPTPDVDGARKGVADALAAWESAAQDLVKWKLSQPGTFSTNILLYTQYDFRRLTIS